MNDKEIKAIKMCRLLLNGDITLHIIDDDGGTAYAGTVNKTYNNDLETVLNLIEKQKAEIEDLKLKIQTQKELLKMKTREIEKKDKIINMLIDEREYIKNNLEVDLNKKGIFSQAKGQISQILEHYKNNDKYFENKVKESK